MSTTNTEIAVTLAIMNERLVQLTESAAQEREARIQLQKQFAEFVTEFRVMSQTVADTTEKVDEYGISHKEYVDIKHKIKAAGWVGKFVWAAAASALTFFASNFPQMSTALNVTPK